MGKKRKAHKIINTSVKSSGWTLFRQMAHWLDKYLDSEIDFPLAGITTLNHLSPRLHRAQQTYRETIKEQYFREDKLSSYQSFVYACLYSSNTLQILSQPVLLFNTALTVTRTPDVTDYHSSYESDEFCHLPEFQQRITKFYQSLENYLIHQKKDPCYTKIKTFAQDEIDDVNVLRENLALSKITTQSLSSTRKEQNCSIKKATIMFLAAALSARACVALLAHHDEHDVCESFESMNANVPYLLAGNVFACVACFTSIRLADEIYDNPALPVQYLNKALTYMRNSFMPADDADLTTQSHIQRKPRAQ